MNWRLPSGLIAAVAGIAGALAHFDVSVHQGERPIVVQGAVESLTKHDGKVSRRECFGFEKHKYSHWTDFIDTYGTPDVGSGDLGYLSYPIRGTDELQYCTLDFGFDDKLIGVEMDLWKEEP